MTTEEADVLQGHRFILIKESSSGLSIRYVDELRANVREDDPARYDDDAFAMILLDTLSLLGEEMTLNVIAKEARGMRWQQGYLLKTPETSSWSQERWDRFSLEERKRVFVQFTPEDRGRSRILICECADPDTADRIVEEHNAIEDLIERFGDAAEN